MCSNLTIVRKPLLICMLLKMTHLKIRLQLVSFLCIWYMFWILATLKIWNICVCVSVCCRFYLSADGWKGLCSFNFIKWFRLKLVSCGGTFSGEFFTEVCVQCPLFTVNSVESCPLQDPWSTNAFMWMKMLWWLVLVFHLFLCYI